MIALSHLQDLFNAALAHHQAGRLGQAEPIYRQILEAAPDQPETLNLLGVLWHQTGRSAQAVELIRRSVALTPTFSNLNNLGEVLRALDRVSEAIPCYRRAIELNPSWPDAHSNLGLAMQDLGQLDQAEQCFARATQLAPQRADLHVRLCVARQKQGDPHGAVLAGRRAIELQPGLAEGWSNLAVALASAEKHEEARHAADRALALAPDRPEAHVNSGFVHERAGRTADAEAAYLKAIELSPNYSLGHRNLAALLDGLDQIGRSIAALERALALQPRDVDGWNNLSTLYRRNCSYPAALAAADKALQLQPGFPAAHGNRGLALLSLGDYGRGFAEYEWRWRCDNFTTAPREFDRPMWDGSDPAGRTIFVHTEQGYGDTIQFVRYVPMLAARGAKVILECAAPLRRLLSSVKGVGKVVIAGVRPPDFDLHIPLLSLPKIFNTTLENLPAVVPYVGVDSDRLLHWKQKLDVAGGGMKVGLVWAGNVKPDPARTCPLENLHPLWQLQGLTFFSLQKGGNAREAASTMTGVRLIDVSEDLRDFADTAAAMANLELILTVDTAAAHLAGALGRPTWTLLPWAADWRWLSDRQDSPWYPTMRLFRQPTRGDWATVVTRITRELSSLSGQ